MNQTILVTGGAGYIGAHTVRQLLAAGHKVVVLDNLSTGRRENIPTGVVFVEGDQGDQALLDTTFSEHNITTVIHFAASIEVGESVEKPLEYLQNNALKTEVLLRAMTDHDIHQLIFSSTAAVYGLQKDMPIPETASTSPIDPYGHSKLIAEQFIHYHAKFSGLKAIIFRYFNACGSDFDKAVYSTHQSHLIPIVIDVTQGRRGSVQIYGNDYKTIDGTGVRDYVHVLDIARAHLAGLDYLSRHSGVEIFNIGTGTGLSVQQVIAAVEQITGKPVATVLSARRPGDSPITVADNTKIRSQLGFEPKYSDIKTIIETSLHL